MKKQKKKWLAVVLVMIMTASLVACSASQQQKTEGTEAKTEQNKESAETETKKEEKTEAGEAVTLRFAWWGGDERAEATQEVIRQFEALHPDITIEPEPASNDGYHDKLATQLSSGTAADIVQIDPEIFPQYVNTGDYFYDLKDLGIDMSGFDQDYIAQEINGMYDGRQLGLPTGVSGGAVLVNKDLADAVGIDFTQDYTWDDLIEWGKKVRQYDDTMYLICANKEYITNMVVWGFMKQLTGTNFFNKKTRELVITEDQLKVCFDYIKALYDNEVVAPPSYTSAYSGDNLQSDPNWINSKYVMTFSYISTIDVMVAANPNGNFIVGKNPIMTDTKDPGASVNTPQVLAIVKSSKHPEAAAQFLDYFFNDDTAAATLKCTRAIPPTQKAREICEKNGDLSTLAKQAVDYGIEKNGLVNDGISSTPEGKTILSDTIEEIAYGAVTTEDAAAEVVDMMKGLVE